MNVAHALKQASARSLILLNASAEPAGVDGIDSIAERGHGAGSRHEQDPEPGQAQEQARRARHRAHTRRAASGEIGAPGEGGSQQRSADQVQWQHQNTAERRVVLDQPQLHEQRADQRFDQDHGERQGRSAPRGVPGRIDSKRRAEQADDRYYAQPRGGAMRVLDGRFQCLRHLQELAVATRPVLAATRARAGDAHDGTKQNHEQRVAEQEPRVAGEAPARVPRRPG